MVQTRQHTLHIQIINVQSTRWMKSQFVIHDVDIS